MAIYLRRAKSIYVVTYPKEGNVAHLKHQLERLEISGYRLKSAGLHLDYQSDMASLRIFVSPAQELRQNRLYQRAEFLLSSSSAAPHEGMEMEAALDSIVEELNSKLTGVQLESLADFTERELGFRGGIKDLAAMLQGVLNSRLFWAGLVITATLLVLLVLTNQ